MIETNKDNLLKVALVGKISHPSVGSSYMTSWDGEPILGIGRGGIVYNVKLGDPCFGWAWGEKVEPGASADGIGEERERNSFRNLTCVGNQVKILGGEAKGEMGTVVGKVGYLPQRAHHVTLHFKESIMEKLAIGDKVQVRAHGVGLEFVEYPGVRVISCSPELLEAMNIQKMGDGIVVPVTKVIPPEFVGQGSGGAPVESMNWDIQTQSPDAIEELQSLRLGDIVMLKDILSAWGRGYFGGAATIGVISCGASNVMGQGIGVTTLLTDREGVLRTRMDPDANLMNYLNLEEE
jgi:hypothetical protein